MFYNRLVVYIGRLDWNKVLLRDSIKGPIIVEAKITGVNDVISTRLLG